MPSWRTATAIPTIRYTLDGTEPTASSPSVANGGTISVTRSVTLKAKAFMDGYTESTTASATFSHIVDLETPDAFLSYVEATGTQFVDTGVKARGGTKVVRTGSAGLVDGGLSGAGTFVLDLGAGKTLTMTKNNTNYKGVVTVAGGTFYVSYCTIAGTGTLDVLGGSKVISTHDYDNEVVSSKCLSGTIRLREGATWQLANYVNRAMSLSVTNLVLDGAVTRAVNTYTLTVTGSITGKGTTPTLTMGSGAVFKPSGTGYLIVTESFSGTMMIDASGLDLESTYDRVPLFKVGSEEMLSSVPVDFVAGTKPKGWVLAKTADGLGYDLFRSGFSIIVR